MKKQCIREFPLLDVLLLPFLFCFCFDCTVVVARLFLFCLILPICKRLFFSTFLFFSYLTNKLNKSFKPHRMRGKETKSERERWNQKKSICLMMHLMKIRALTHKHDLQLRMKSLISIESHACSSARSSVRPRLAGLIWVSWFANSHAIWEKNTWRNRIFLEHIHTQSFNFASAFLFVIALTVQPIVL